MNSYNNLYDVEENSGAMTQDQTLGPDWFFQAANYKAKFNNWVIATKDQHSWRERERKHGRVGSQTQCRVNVSLHQGWELRQYAEVSIRSVTKGPCGEDANPTVALLGDNGTFNREIVTGCAWTIRDTGFGRIVLMWRVGGSNKKDAVKEASLAPHLWLSASWLGMSPFVPVCDWLEMSPFVPVCDSTAYHTLHQNWADEDPEHSPPKLWPGYTSFQEAALTQALHHFLIWFLFFKWGLPRCPGWPQIRGPPTSVSWAVSNLVGLHRGNKNMVSREQNGLEWAWEDWPCHNNRTLDVECPTSLSFCQSCAFSFSSLCRAAVQGNPSSSLHGMRTYQLVNNSARIIINYYQ